ncbi:18198_t:CDS:2 [Funneliformis geosporum]|nr:18198_t:CDS:2 [Funneliformis geosporum]
MDKLLTLASGSSYVSPFSAQKQKENLQNKNWNSKWPKEYLWIAQYAFIIGTQKFKKDYLNTHLSTKEYQKAAFRHTVRLSDQMELTIGFTIQADINKLNIIAKM